MAHYYPDFGMAPIKCGRRACRWRGFETDLAEAQVTKGSLLPGRISSVGKVCPSCGHGSYIFMSTDEIAAWDQRRSDGVSHLWRAPVPVRVVDAGGTYTTSTVLGKRCSCTHGAAAAVAALIAKVSTARGYAEGYLVAEQMPATGLRSNETLWQIRAAKGGA